MEAEGEKVRTNIEKKKILAILPNNQELQGDIYNIKLYSSDREGVDWLYSGLEGSLGLIVDYQVKTKYLALYDPSNYEKVFQYEVYNEFEKYFEELNPEFRSFEIESGFIGIQFDSQEDADNFTRTLKKLIQMKNIFNTSKEKENSKLQNEKFQGYCRKLKKTFCAGEAKYDEKYAEDGTQILKHRNFKVLSNISYDKAKKKFEFGKISEDLKQMFLSYGIKKKDLESDVDFAFSLFKKMIVGLGSENKLKNSAVDKIEHTFLPPEEREMIRRQEEAAEAKLNIKRTQRKNKNNNISCRPSRITRCGPPPPPPPPPPVPSSTPVQVTQGKVTTNSNKTPEVDRSTQLQNIKLKKVVKDEKKENKDKNFQGTGKNFLQNALSTAIQNRRKNLHLHDEEDDNDDEDDWD